MPDHRRRTCLTCGQSDRVVGPISWRGNCQACGELVLSENISGIAAKAGYAYKRQLRGMLRYASSALDSSERTV